MMSITTAQLRLHALLLGCFIVIAWGVWPDLVAADEKTLTVLDWRPGEDMFESHRQQLQSSVDYPLVRKNIGAPFSENIEQRFIYSEGIDVVGMFSSGVHRLSQAGWIDDLSGDDRFEMATARSSENVSDFSTFGQHIYGVGQVATGVAVPFVDMVRYESLGLGREDFPEDWDTLSDQLISLAGKGHTANYLPFWFDDIAGLPLGFVAEVENRGGEVIATSSNRGMMEPYRGPAYDTLVDWRRLMSSGAVDQRVLDYSHLQFVTAYLVGNHLLSANQIDVFLKASTALTDRRKLTVLPRGEQDWGLVEVYLFGLPSQPGESEERNEARRKLLLEITRGSAESEFSMARMWLAKYGYFSAFKDYMSSKEALGILRSKLDYPSDLPVLIDIFDNLDRAKNERRVIWHHEFFDFLKLQLQEYLRTPSVEPSDVIRSINRKIMELRTLYGY